MTDDQELIARLREGATWDDDVAAADRIEALIKERDEAVHLARLRKTFIEEARDERDALEAKLAQVVEVMRKTLDAIEWYNQPDEDGLYWGGANADLIAQEIVSARATLAEIKGESQ